MRRILAVALVLTGGIAVAAEARERRRRATAVYGPLLVMRTEPIPAATVPQRRRRSRLRSAAGLTWLFASRAAAGFALTLLALLALSYATGFRSMTVMSGSMEPAVHTGDVVVNRPVVPLDARVGDVITFRDPAGGGFVTHRVRRVNARGGTVTFVTKGDANTGSERWTTPADGEIGRVEYRLPRLGYALFWTRGTHARLMLVTVPALLLGLLLVAEIWRPRRREAPRAAVA